MRVIRKSISEFTESEKIHIDGYIEENGGLIFHETKFNEIASETFKSKLSYFLAYSDQTLIGVCPIHTIKRGKLKDSYSNNGSFEIPYGGWVYDKKKATLKVLMRKMSFGWNESLTYWTGMGDIPENLNAKSINFQTGIIDLKNSEKVIFENIIHSKRRNMIRKSVKSGVIIEKYGTDGLSIYLSMMHDMRQKTGLKSKSLNYFENIFNAYSATGNVVLMVAYKNERPLSGVIIAGNKNIMHYWQGASISGAPNLGQGELLQWEAIKWAKNQGSEYYDLCVIEPERLHQIAQFKMGFTKQLIPFHCITKRTLLFRGLNKMQNLLQIK